MKLKLAILIMRLFKHCPLLTLLTKTGRKLEIRLMMWLVNSMRSINFLKSILEK